MTILALLIYGLPIFICSFLFMYIREIALAARKWSNMADTLKHDNEAMARDISAMKIDINSINKNVSDFWFQQRKV